MRAAGTVKVGTRKAQKFGTESLDERNWTGEVFENMRRCSENKRQWWLQDMGQADGKKSRRRAWSSQVKGEAKQTTLGVNPNAPLACSSQSKQTSSPTTAQSKPLRHWSPTCDLQLQSRLLLKFQHVYSIPFGGFVPVEWAWVGHNSRRGATPGLSPRELSGHAHRSHSKNSLLTQMLIRTSKFAACHDLYCGYVGVATVHPSGSYALLHRQHEAVTDDWSWPARVSWQVQGPCKRHHWQAFGPGTAPG